MSDLRFTITGAPADVTAAAEALRAALGEGAPVAESVIAAPQDDIRRAVDPVALAGVILAVPGAVLAVVDLVDRLGKRRKAEALVAAAQRLRRERQVSVEVTGPDGAALELDRLEPDHLLDMAEAPPLPPPPS